MKKVQHKDGYQYYSCFNLKTIQETQLKLLEFIDSICRREGIRYWILAGTLIGTIRHKGHFVPWDDDIDVSLLYSDYVKLIEALRKECETHKNYFLAFDNTDVEYYFEKICTSELLVKSIDTGEKSPCAIDIFPLKSVEDSESAILEDENLTDKLHFYIHGFFNKERNKGSLKYNNLNEAINAKREYFKSFHEQCVSNEKQLFDSGKLSLVNYNLYPFFLPHKGGFFKYNDIYPLEDVVFEGIKVMKPHNHDAILREQYGDYSQFPPLESRIPMHSSQIVRCENTTKESVVVAYRKLLKKKDKVFYYRQKNKLVYILFCIINFGLFSTMHNFRIVRKISKLLRKI